MREVFDRMIAFLQTVSVNGKENLKEMYNTIETLETMRNSCRTVTKEIKEEDGHDHHDQPK